ncbi:hypothetical protein [Helicobacter pylori]|uniref:hypothetical protein n=1 Tax=Helicobacter pylori TaxID=210 RepID=UPI002928A3A2|nr:hypothetical protein [Helicobacter pylori]MDU9746491.1 hypothetical protein [Helicobacter pylori]
MRQKHETATSFNQLKEITQMMQAQKRRLKTSENAHENDSAHKLALKPKARAKTKNHALKPTKRAFSERQKTAFRDNSQANAKKSQETKQANSPGDNANAFKSDEAKERGQQ